MLTCTCGCAHMKNKQTSSVIKDLGLGLGYFLRLRWRSGLACHRLEALALFSALQSLRHVAPSTRDTFPKRHKGDICGEIKRFTPPYFTSLLELIFPSHQHHLSVSFSLRRHAPTQLIPSDPARPLRYKKPDSFRPNPWKSVASPDATRT